MLKVALFMSLIFYYVRSNFDCIHTTEIKIVGLKSMKNTKQHLSFNLLYRINETVYNEDGYRTFYNTFFIHNKGSSVKKANFNGTLSINSITISLYLNDTNSPVLTDEYEVLDEETFKIKKNFFYFISGNYDDKSMPTYRYMQQSHDCNIKHVIVHLERIEIIKIVEENGEESYGLKMIFFMDKASQTGTILEYVKTDEYSPESFDILKAQFDLNRFRTFLSDSEQYNP